MALPVGRWVVDPLQCPAEASNAESLTVALLLGAEQASIAPWWQGEHHPKIGGEPEMVIVSEARRGSPWSGSHTAALRTSSLAEKRRELTSYN